MPEIIYQVWFMIPLFQITYFWKDTSSSATDSRIFLMVIFVLFALVILYALVHYLIQKSKESNKSQQAKPVTQRTLQRSAQASGFSSIESEFLSFYAQKLAVYNYRDVLKDNEKLDRFLRDIYHYIEKNSKTEQEAEELKKKLFMIREAHSFRFHSSKTIRSTHEIPKMTPLSLVTTHDVHYATILLANENDGLYVEYPRDAFGDLIKFALGTKLSVYFYTGNHAGFQFKSKVKEKLKSKTKAVLKLKHTHMITALPYRKHDRKSVRMECSVYRSAVQTANTGSGLKRILQSEKTPLPGILTDISAGGVSFHSTLSMMPGDVLKLEFNPGLGRRTAYITIIRVNRIKNGFLYHAKYIKIDTKTVNEVYALVYGYL